jgi:TetR/AcrR family transcriptional regulator, regulator of mycofactocin system
MGTGTTGTIGTLRERHALRTRQAIEAAALELFDERGFAETTVEEIAARADVAPRTFFRYFPAKEAVLFPDTAGIDDRLARALAARPADEHPFASLVAVVADLADDVEARGADFERRERLARNCPGVRAYERSVLDARVAGTVAAFVAGRLGVAAGVDPRPQMWAALVMTAFRVALHLWLDAGRTGHLRDAVAAALSAAAEVAPVSS